MTEELFKEFDFLCKKFDCDYAAMYVYIYNSYIYYLNTNNSKRFVYLQLKDIIKNTILESFLRESHYVFIPHDDEYVFWSDNEIKLIKCDEQ